MRPDNWTSVLNEYLKSCYNKKFEWGKFDCCTFACDWAVKMGQPDPMGEMRGKYSTAQGALKLMLKMGNGTVKGITDYCGDDRFTRISPARAKRGDVMVLTEVGFDNEMDACMGVCIGERVAIVSENGILYAPREKAIISWST